MLNIHRRGGADAGRNGEEGFAETGVGEGRDEVLWYFSSSPHAANSFAAQLAIAKVSLMLNCRHACKSGLKRFS